MTWQSPGHISATAALQFWTVLQPGTPGNSRPSNEGKKHLMIHSTSLGKI